jgi:hypothetical protein
MKPIAKKNLIHLSFIMVVLGFITDRLQGADISRRLIMEIDPMASSSSVYDQNYNNMTNSRWGGHVDFNVGGIISTGPEFWLGAFTVRGPTEPDQTYRREDLWPGERQKLDALRLRWHFTLWENGASMRGWYVSSAYNYLRVNSRANRFAEPVGTADAVPVGTYSGNPDENTSLVTDIRHGFGLGVGNRWLFLDQKLTFTLGISMTRFIKRALNVEGKDPNTKTDYEDLIESIPDTRMSTRGLPEANLGIGFAW